MATTIGGNTIDSDGALNFVTTDGTISTIDTAGNVLTAQRPSFKYHAGSTGNGEWSNYDAYLSKCHNIGSAFNLSTGQFTAPVAGLYQFNMVCMTTGSSGDSRFALYRNGGNVGGWRTIVVSTQGNAHNNCSFGITCYLAQGDYVRPIMYSGSQAYGGTWNTWSGYYIGEYT